MSNKDTCRSCGTEILWVELNSGRKMPFDARTSKVLYRKLKGTRYVDTKEGSYTKDVYEDHVLDGHVPHFVTCPDSDEWSGSSRSERGDSKK